MVGHHPLPLKETIMTVIELINKLSELPLVAEVELKVIDNAQSAAITISHGVTFVTDITIALTNGK